MKLLRACLLFALSMLLLACASRGDIRVFPPSASIQQLSVGADGSWTVQLRLQNYSNVGMRFDSVALKLKIADLDAGTLASQTAVEVVPESAEQTTVRLVPSAAARLQVADALASGRSLAYALDGTLSATPSKGGSSRNYPVSYRNSLSPAPGLPGVLR